MLRAIRNCIGCAVLVCSRKSCQLAIWFLTTCSGANAICLPELPRQIQLPFSPSGQGLADLQWLAPPWPPRAYGGADGPFESIFVDWRHVRSGLEFCIGILHRRFTFLALVFGAFAFVSFDSQSPSIDIALGDGFAWRISPCSRGYIESFHMHDMRSVAIRQQLQDA
jgi:hypothetical protein